MGLGNLVRRIRFKVSDLFLLAVAVAGGMAVYRIRADAPLACVGGITAIVALGLGLQAWDFSRLAWAQRISTPQGMAVWFAAGWRVVVTAWLIIQYVPGIGAFATDSSKSDDIRVHDDLEQVTLSVVLFVLAASAPRKSTARAQRWFSRAVDWIGCVALAILVAIWCAEAGMVYAMVTTACNGIELTRPFKVMVPGMDGQIGARMDRFFWTGIAGTLLIAVASGSWAYLARAKTDQSIAAVRSFACGLWMAMALVFLATLAGGCWITVYLWTSGWMSLSPAMAEGLGNWSLNWIELTCLVTLAVLLVTCGAYRLTADARDTSTGAARPLRRYYYHEQRVVLFLVGLLLVVCFITGLVPNRTTLSATAESLANIGVSVPPMTLARLLRITWARFMGSFESPSEFVVLAIGLQIMAWAITARALPAHSTLSFQPLSPVRFALNWLALAALLPAAAVIVGAMSAGIWFAPWHRSI